MCGIVGMLRLDGGVPDPRSLATMTDALSHRGPDDRGTFVAGPIAFGFRRLSILDLSPAGHQPMTAAGGEATIVFNGEIYNFVELRAELEAKGHRFVSRGDTEVLLHAYLEWGSNCLQRLNGMFAFLIYDARSGTIFGARDRFGVKPLFIYRDTQHILFASEIKGLRAGDLCVADAANLEVAANYLIKGDIDVTPDSFFAGIRQLAPGTAFTCTRDGTMREWRFWSIDQTPDAGNDDPIRRFADLFEDAVRLRMRSDVPVGVCLSGGLDSTAIICAMARGAADASAINAFCFVDREFDETRYITDTLSQVRAVPHYVEMREDRVWAQLAEMLIAQDEPVQSLTPLIGLELMKLAAECGVKVVLNGQGSDEVCAGYSSYFMPYWQGLLRRGHWVKAEREIAAYAHAHRVARGHLLVRQADILLRDPLRRVEPWRGFLTRHHIERLRSHPWFSPELTRHVTFDPATHDVPPLRTVLQRSVERDPMPLYLRIEDRNSMAHSVEVRLPFMDYRLVAHVFAQRDDFKLRGPWNKYGLREAMRGRIPESVRTRMDKMGFPAPQRRWVAGMLYGSIRDLLSSRSARERGFYNLAAIEADLDRHRRGEVDLAVPLLRVCQFELWNRAVLFRRGAAAYAI